MEPKVLGRGQWRKNLQLVADTLNILVDNKNDYCFYVSDVYFDIGQDWMWTTIIVYNADPWKQYQLLNPRDWEEIIEAKTPLECLKIGERLYREEGVNKWL